jgi:hypothetical protein
MTESRPAGRRVERMTTGLASWGYVAVGAVVATGEAATRLVADVRQGAGRAGRRSVGRLVNADRTVRTRIAALAELGAAERERRQRRAAEALTELVRALATAPLVNVAVDAQLDRVLRPLVVVVLDDVLMRLEEEPDRVRALVRGQRDTMVDELVGRLRASAAAGDAAVDRVTDKLLRRVEAAAPPAGP